MAAIKQKKDYKLDAVIQGKKKLKRMLKIKEIHMKQPGMVMLLRNLEKYRRQLGLIGKKRVVALLNRFPGVFHVYKEGSIAKYFRFTIAAKKQYLDEKRLYIMWTMTTTTTRMAPAGNTRREASNTRRCSLGGCGGMGILLCYVHSVKCFKFGIVSVYRA